MHGQQNIKKNYRLYYKGTKLCPNTLFKILKNYIHVIW